MNKNSTPITNSSKYRKDKMKILLVIRSMSAYNGGPPRVVAGTAKALAQRGHLVTVAVVVDDRESIDTILNEYPSLNHKNISILTFNASFPLFLMRSNKLIIEMSKMIHEYDIVHVHAVWESLAWELFLLNQRYNKPFFVSIHGNLTPWAMRHSGWKKNLALKFLPVKRMLENADAIIYGSQEELENSHQSLKSKSLIVPNGIDVSSMSRENLPDDNQLRKLFPHLNNWDRVFLFYSRIHPKKGLHLLVDAFFSLENIDNSVGLFIVGIPQDKPYENDLRALIYNSPHRDRIIFTTELVGKESQVALKCADVFVLPSYQEGFSMSILEAMACELPVLISDKCHFSEVETEWNAGYVVSQDVVSLTKGLAKMISLSKTELKEMGARGREVIVNKFDWNAVAELLERVYLGVE